MSDDLSATAAVETAALVVMAGSADVASPRRALIKRPDDVPVPRHELAAAAANAAARVGVSASHVTALRAATAIELAQTAALRQALAILHARGVEVLVMKGVAVAHLAYGDGLRPRSDDDLLVRPAAFARASIALRDAGYALAPQITSPEVTGQLLLSKRVFGISHHVDLHARPLNPYAFADLPEFDELWAGSVLMPGLEAARAIGVLHALLLACAHRVAHHTPTEDPLWLYDIDRLASLLGSADWRPFVAMATRARCARVCATELRRAQADHGTRVPAHALDQLELAEGEPSERHLLPLGPLHVQWLNLRQAPSWRARLALLRAHIFPPAAYMRARFDPHGQRAVVSLYTRRLVLGGTRWVGEFVDRVLG